MSKRRIGIHNLGMLGVTDQAARMPGISYAEKVLSYNPIAYWIMGEAAGLTAIDQVNSPAQDGTYAGVTLGQPGIGDGNTCPLFDGVNDYNNIYSVALNAAWNGQEFTAMVWLRVSGVGVWIDGVARYAFHMRVDGTNFWQIEKSLANNRLDLSYVAGGVSKTVQYVTSNIGWINATMSVSLSAGVNGEMKAYIGGAQIGVTQVALGTWAGALFPNWSALGAQNNVPNLPFSGFLAHGVLFPVLSDAQIATLAMI